MRVRFLVQANNENHRDGLNSRLINYESVPLYNNITGVAWRGEWHVGPILDGFLVSLGLQSRQ